MDNETIDGGAIDHDGRDGRNNRVVVRVGLERKSSAESVVASTRTIPRSPPAFHACRCIRVVDLAAVAYID